MPQFGLDITKDKDDLNPAPLADDECHEFLRRNRRHLRNRIGRVADHLRETRQEKTLVTSAYKRGRYSPV